MSNEVKTPILDFAPKAISTIIKCQNILAEYVVPDSGINDHECINRLLAVLDDQAVVKGINDILTPPKKESTGFKDKNGKEIFEGDPLLLEFETIKMKGVAKISPTTGEWNIYKDEGNHLGIEENSHLITNLS